MSGSEEADSGQQETLPEFQKMSSISAFNEKEEVEANTHFRKTIATTPQLQIVAMCITAEDAEIPEEQHHDATQVFRIYSGKGLLMVNNVQMQLMPGMVAIVPPNTRHTVMLLGSEPLKLASIYSPPQHHPLTIQPRRIGAAIRLLEKMTIISIHDGDTVMDSNKRKYRLYGIDAPELKQTYGPKARKALEEFVRQGEIYAQLHGVEKYGRMLVTLYSVPSPSKKWHNINYAMVASGHAWVYRFKKEETRRGEPLIPKLEEYENAQVDAKTRQRGLWNASDIPIPPSEFRKMKKYFLKHT